MKEVFVMSFGFVLMGEIACESPKDFVIDNASVVRRWGTTAGVGELAITGPTATTILDPLPNGTVIQKSAIIFRIPCS